MNAWPQGDDMTNQRGRTEPPLPPELSPRRGAARGGVPPQAAYGGGGGPGGGSYSTSRSGGPGVPGSGARRVKVILATVLVVVLVWSVGTYFWADSKLNHAVDLSKVEERPAEGEGTNYLIVGSDSRAGLSDEQKKELHTGSADGSRTDSMILLHVGDNGTTMLSLPRDSWVTIPAFTGSTSGKRFAARQSKLNAAFNTEGPELLVRTIEFNTGLHIDHYAEIGFAGFANIVDAVGGVDMCLDKAVKDKNSGADLKAGCQTLDGSQSLAFVRQRYQEAQGDLGRTKNQQKFLSALASQTATPATVLNPFKLYPTMGAGLDSLTVDTDMSMWNLASMFWAMKGVTGGDGQQMNVPVSNPGFRTPDGQSAVLWDSAESKQLFGELKADQKVTVSSS